MLKELAASNAEIFQVVVELNKPQQSEKAVKKVIEKYGRINGLVNNAGQNEWVGLEYGNYENFMAGCTKI